MLLSPIYHLVWFTLSFSGLCTPTDSRGRNTLTSLRQLDLAQNGTSNPASICKKDMPGLRIEVVGSATISRPAERAIMSLSIRSEGPDQRKVATDVTDTSNDIQSILRSLSNKNATGDNAAPGNPPISKWSMTTLSTSSYQPYESDGRQQRQRIYTASIHLSIEFADFAKLSTISTTLSTKPFVNINSISWQLTKETRSSFATESRKSAVADAFRKAQDYASAAGKENLVYCEIKDSSSEGGGGSSPQFPVPMMAMARGGGASAADAPQLSFEPEKLDVHSSINVVFVAE